MALYEDIEYEDIEIADSIHDFLANSERAQDCSGLDVEKVKEICVPNKFDKSGNHIEKQFIKDIGNNIKKDNDKTYYKNIHISQLKGSSITKYMIDSYVSNNFLSYMKGKQQFYSIASFWDQSSKNKGGKYFDNNTPIKAVGRKTGATVNFSSGANKNSGHIVLKHSEKDQSFKLTKNQIIGLKPSVKSLCKLLKTLTENSDGVDEATINTVIEEALQIDQNFINKSKSIEDIFKFFSKAENVLHVKRSGDYGQIAMCEASKCTLLTIDRLCFVKAIQEGVPAVLLKHGEYASAYLESVGPNEASKQQQIDVSIKEQVISLLRQDNEAGIDKIDKLSDTSSSLPPPNNSQRLITWSLLESLTSNLTIIKNKLLEISTKIEELKTIYKEQILAISD